MATKTIDFQASTITIRTRAKGMLSRLAHDLEIDASRWDGAVELDGDAWKATLTFDVRGLRVVGALKGDRVDRAVLSASDKDEIERKIRSEVLPIDSVTVSLSGTDRKRADVVVAGLVGEQKMSVPITVEERRDGELVVFGDLKLSLSRLGIKEIKGPLGAFKVDDAIAVAFWLMLAGDAEDG